MASHVELAAAAVPAPYYPSSERLARVAAVVVLYHPSAALLERLIASIAEQVDKIFVVDNTPGEGAQKPALLEECDCPSAYFGNGVNKGLATAQNIGIRHALAENYTHVLLLDQDSALPEGAVEGLLAAEASLLRAGEPVSAVGPLFIDEKTGERSRGVHHGRFHIRWFPIAPEQTEPVETDYVIASGSLIRAEVLRHVGLMRDELFIDWVDTEWAYRANSFGYSTYVVPTVMMRHSVGDATGELMGKRYNLHSPARNFYIVRNAAYLLRDRRMSLNWRLTMVVYIPKYILIHGCLSQRPLRSMLQMLRGVWEGLAGTMRPF